MHIHKLLLLPHVTRSTISGTVQISALTTGVTHSFFTCPFLCTLACSYYRMNRPVLAWCSSLTHDQKVDLPVRLHCLVTSHCMQGISVEGQENIQEILTKQLVLCQYICALSILQTGPWLALKCPFHSTCSISIGQFGCLSVYCNVCCS